MATKTKEKPKKAKKAKLPKTGRIHMRVLLDESGSMSPNRDAVLDGTNEFVNDLKGEKNAKKATIGVSAFDSREPMCRVVREGTKLEDFEPLTPTDYMPNAMTPLNDSIAQTISETEADMKKGDKALVVIFTDGHENSSREFSKEDIKALIAKKEKKGFTFIYLGANVDAQAEGSAMGMSVRGQATNFRSTPKGTKRAFGVVSANVGAAYLANDGDGSALYASMAKSGDIAEDDDDSGAVPQPRSSTRSSANLGESRDKAASVLSDE